LDLWIEVVLENEELTRTILRGCVFFRVGCPQSQGCCWLLHFLVAVTACQTLSVTVSDCRSVRARPDALAGPLACAHAPKVLI
jgi:hypothetical protein